ncbi:hypothetical protein [Nodularia chucula]|uniref:hypothetical protein n=1 Tax=Nodularia chucula TaxID=3093667 RepID=UPI0039C5ED97
MKLSDEVYTALQQKASAVGLSVAELVATSLNTQYSLSVGHKSDAEEARQRLLGFAGVISMGYATIGGGKLKNGQTGVLIKFDTGEIEWKRRRAVADQAYVKADDPAKASALWREINE